MDQIPDLTVIATVGGEGTRMYPLTLNFPKPLLPICNYPIIKRTVEIFVTQGARKFIFASKGYFNTIAIKDVMRFGRDTASRKGVEKIDFRYPPKYDDLGSADATRNAMEWFNINDYVLVVGGDQIMDVNIKEMLKFHKEKKALMTIGLTKVENISEYGIAVLDNNNKILKFVEKPKEDVGSNLANIGVYILSPEIREIFKQAPKEKVRDFGKDFIPYVVENNYDVYGYIHNGYWNDVGNVDEYLKTTLDILQGKVKNITLESSSNKAFNPIKKVDEGIYIRASTLEKIEEKLKNKKILTKGNVLIGGDCEIFDDVVIENSCIGDGCRIKKGTLIKNSVVMDFSEIGEKCIINKAIIGRFASVDDGSRIDADYPQNIESKSPTRTPVIGDNVYIFKNSIIFPTERVAPLQDAHKILSTGKFVSWGMDTKNFYFSLI